jgi:hypothetical protein
MPKPKHSPEAKVIEQAFAEQIAQLYRMLVADLNNMDPEETAMAKFSRGLTTAKLAHDLALQQITTQSDTEK